MPVTKYYDTPNNLIYNAIGTAAWYGAEGATLRSQGWTYCGFGTGGIYLAPPGGPCYTKGSQSSQPNILPPAPPTDTPGPSSAVPDKACGACKKSTVTAPASPITGAPAPTPGARPASKSSLPWWLWVLVALTAAQVVYGRNNA